MTKVKICGLTEQEHAIAAARAGADFLGLIFAPARRQLTPENGHEIVQAVRQLGLPARTVGVFVNLLATEVNRVADFCGVDWVQLSGDESWQYCRDISRPFIKVIHVTSGRQTSSVLNEIRDGYCFLTGRAFICTLDAKIGSAYGGTGRAFDWQLAREVAARLPVIIAGGLTPDNVGHLVREVKPWGVDVSSGVETNGTKDIAKIKSFIEAVRQAEHQLDT